MKYNKFHFDFLQVAPGYLLISLIGGHRLDDGPTLASMRVAFCQEIHQEPLTDAAMDHIFTDDIADALVHKARSCFEADARCTP